MKKKLLALAFAGASLAMFAGAPSAGAAHCAGSPSDHAQATAGSDHDHADHFGWSSCTDSQNAGKARSAGDSAGKSGEAPGQNR